MPNRLAGALSPYLRQHADNPVDWWPWCDEAFVEARRRDVPILLSVGYAACHWCHVMAHESFEDPITARLLNEHFVTIKVDREERPDIDSVYMAATQALTGRGGWPMTVFLDHDGGAFYAGTYFPPRRRHGMPSFRDVLHGVDQAWRTDRARVSAMVARLDAVLRDPSAPEGFGSHRPEIHGPGADRLTLDDLTVDDVAATVDRLWADFDPRSGGFGGAPKFPPSLVLEFLLRADALLARADRPDLDQAAHRARTMADRTLGAMARGGMHDHLEGGFARYSVDADWVVPHFEKMLYDNALLARVYLHHWRATRDPNSRLVAIRTCDFLVTHLRTDEGGFASSLDADSDGQEGACYVWTPAQLVDVLGPDDGNWVAALCDVTGSGTFEHGTSVLQLRHDPDDPARWERCRAALTAARHRRTQPARDDKVVAAWNGLAIAALAEAGALLDRPDWTDAATACADLLMGLHWRPETGHLLRVSLAGEVAPDGIGVLEDYADLAEGLLALYQTTGEERHFTEASMLIDRAVELFSDGSGWFHDTARDAPPLPRRPRDPTDGVAPSGPAAMAQALLTRAALTGDTHHLESADAALAALVPVAKGTPRFSGWTWATIAAHLAGPTQVAVVLPAGPGTPADRHDPPPSRRPLDPLHATALGSTSPGLVVGVGGERGSSVPLLRDRPALEGRATAYACREFVCDLPVTTPNELRRLLGD